MLEQILTALPISAAMPTLRAPKPRKDPSAERVLALLSTDVNAAQRAAALIFIDDIDAAHEICQDMPDSLGSLLHGIVHRREGDFDNADYWLRRSRSLIEALGTASFALNDGARFDDGKNDPNLLAAQRLEWQAVFTEASK